VNKKKVEIAAKVFAALEKLFLESTDPTLFQNSGVTTLCATLK